MRLPPPSELFCASNLQKALLDRANFAHSAMVETDYDPHDEALAYIFSNQMQGRGYRSIRARDWRVLWLFEIVEDAIQFRLKFGGICRTKTTLADWRRS